jgi:hypothetical protein
MEVLIESVANLSRITANHDQLLTKLVDDHEQRIRQIEREGSKLAENTAKIVEKNTTRIEELERWRSYVIGASVGASAAFTYLLHLFGI